VGRLRRNKDFDQHPITNIIRPLTAKTGKKERKKSNVTNLPHTNVMQFFPIHDGLTEEAGCVPGEGCLIKVFDVSLSGRASPRPDGACFTKVFEVSLMETTLSRPDGACFAKVFSVSLMGLVSWRHLFYT
jgi:hypothetical protein